MVCPRKKIEVHSSSNVFDQPQPQSNFIISSCKSTKIANTQTKIYIQGTMCFNQPQPKSNFANSCKINNKNNTYTKKNVQGAMCFDQPQPKSNFVIFL